MCIENFANNVIHQCTQNDSLRSPDMMANNVVPGGAYVVGKGAENGKEHV